MQIYTIITCRIVFAYIVQKYYILYPLHFNVLLLGHGMILPFHQWLDRHESKYFPLLPSSEYIIWENIVSLFETHFTKILLFTYQIFVLDFTTKLFLTLQQNFLYIITSCIYKTTWLHTHMHLYFYIVQKI